MFQMTTPEQARTLEGRAHLCRVPTGRWIHVSPGKSGQRPKLRPLDGGSTWQVADRDQLFADLEGATCYNLDDLNRLSQRVLHPRRRQRRAGVRARRWLVPARVSRGAPPRRIRGFTP